MSVTGLSSGCVERAGHRSTLLVLFLGLCATSFLVPWTCTYIPNIINSFIYIQSFIFVGAQLSWEFRKFRCVFSLLCISYIHCHQLYFSISAFICSSYTLIYSSNTFIYSSKRRHHPAFLSFQHSATVSVSVYSVRWSTVSVKPQVHSYWSTKLEALLLGLFSYLFLLWLVPSSEVPNLV